MGNARKYGLDYIKKLPIAEADNMIQNKIESLFYEKAILETVEIECQIDQLVYQLYDLTAEEIAIIENGIK